MSRIINDPDNMLTAKERAEIAKLERQKRPAAGAHTRLPAPQSLPVSLLSG